MARAAKMEDEAIPFGLIGYPVLQSADILMPRAHLVPVGKDNEAHVEVTREIARRFNHYYGEVFPVPDPLIGEVPSLVGTDGQLVAGMKEKSPYPRVSGIFKSGWFGGVTTVVHCEITFVNEPACAVTLTGVAREGLLNQRSARRAVGRLARHLRRVSFTPAAD